MSIEMNIAPLISSSGNVSRLPEVDNSASSTAPVDVSFSVRREDSEEKQSSDNSVAGQDLEAVVTEMNAVAQNLQRDLLFSVDEKSGGTFVKVIDKDTDEIVREIPSSEIRAIKARLEEISGLIFNGSV